MAHHIQDSLLTFGLALLLTFQASSVVSLQLRGKTRIPARPRMQPCHTGIVAPLDSHSSDGYGSAGSYSSTGSSSSTGGYSSIGSSNSSGDYEDDADVASGAASASSKSSTSTRTQASYLQSPIKGISYKGGAIMADPVEVYLLFLGNFTERRKQIVRRFINSLDTTADPENTVAQWWNITGLYYNENGKRASRRITIAGEVNPDTVPQVKADKGKGFVLEGALSVRQIVKDSVDKDKGGVWPANSNAIYAVITDSTINQKGLPSSEKRKFCSHYCGWHSTTRSQGEILRYLWVGLADKICPNRCIPKHLRSKGFSAPDNDAGIHSAISMLAHELSETVTDPGGNSWVRNDGMENADLCAWRFGTTQQKPTKGGKRVVYNLVGQNRAKFFLQTNWDFVDGKCRLGIMTDPGGN